MQSTKIVLGLSGGVDSAVALSLLREQGFEVHCVFLDNGLGGAEDARRVAAEQGSSFSIVDISTALERHVCAPFAAGYAAGETPSPCVLCNPTVKFPALFAEADRMGAEAVATGHYARTAQGPNGTYCLKKARSEKDQSYMLARLRAEWLPRLMFPLGDLDKNQVRDLAKNHNISVADKPDSMEICFISDDDYAAWLEARGCCGKVGNFVLRDGTVLGAHKGIHHYTLGQGKGLGVSYSHRLFVSEIRVETNEVVLSDGSDLWTTSIRATGAQLLAPLPERVAVKLRHSKTETPATVMLEGDTLFIETDTPVRAPTAGQLAVCYQDDTVVASGWISKAIPHRNCAVLP